MKKVAVLLALLALFACTPKKNVVTGIYLDPVETITEPIHLEYGPGSQSMVMSVSADGFDETFAMSCDVDYDVRRKDDNLFYEGIVKNMKIQNDQTRTSIDGVFLVNRAEITTSGEVLEKNVVSELLNAEQLEKAEKSIGSSLDSLAFVNQDVVTGSVVFNIRDSITRDLDDKGFVVEGADFVFTLSGYVWHKGEKALLLECHVPSGVVRKKEDGFAMDFAFSSYALLRSSTCQNLYMETVMEFSVPEISESLVMEMVINEK